jgi:outer membrane receptor protein involved in Fe transport
MMAITRFGANLVTFALAGLALYALAPAPVSAVEPPAVEDLSLEQLLDAQVETPALRRSRLATSPSTVSVLTREEIRRFGFLTVAEAVNSVVGMDVLAGVTVKQIPTARGILQSLYANKVLLMLNGIPTWHAITADGILNRVSLDQVERIEVVRGPVSVLYGTNAYAGAVNIVLRKPGLGGGSGQARWGGPNLWDAGVTVSTQLGPIDLLIGAGGSFERRRRYPFTGIDQFTFNFREQEQTNNFTAIAGYGGHQLMLNSFFYSHPSYGAQTAWSGGAGPLDNRGLLAAYKYERMFQRGRVVATASYDHHLRNFLRGPQDRRIVLYSEGRRISTNVKGYYDLSEHFGLELGLYDDHRIGDRWEDMNTLNNRIETSYGIRDVSVSEASVLAQVNAAWRAFSLLVGARATKNSLYDGNLSTRATATWAIAPSHSLRLIAGQSFRSPSIFELNYVSREVIGNRALVPETAHSVELVHALGTRSLFVQTAAYYAHHREIIQRTAQPGTAQRKYANVTSFDGAGLEIEARWNHRLVGDGYFGFAHTRGVDTDGRLSPTDDNYRYVPRHALKAGVGREFGHFRLGANGQVISSVQGHLARIEPQAYVDLHAGWTHTAGPFSLRHTVSAKNVTGSRMLTPEYIRQYPTINELPTMGYGRRLVYTMSADF